MIYYKGGERVGEATGLKPLTAQTTVVTDTQDSSVTGNAPQHRYGLH